MGGNANPMELAPASATFSFEFFAALIASVRDAGYTFRRIDEPPAPAGQRTFYLRHDVDISPICAEKLGEVAAGAGARSSFFFQLNAETYGIFSQENRRIMTRLRSLGHCVGLHIDEALIGEAEAPIIQTLDWFNQCCWPVDRAVSFHRPSKNVLGRRYDGFVNSYAPGLWGEDRYLSDSRRQIAFWDRLQEWLREGRTPIQLLLHPVWWHPHPDIECLWKDLRARRVLELERYVLANFSKVFASVIKPSDFLPTV